MEFHGNIDLLENELRKAVLGADTNFPANPKPGRFVFKDAVLYFCTEYDGGLPVWVPITKIREMEVFKQTTDALEWSIPHGLNTNAVFTQVYDDAGNWIIPDSIKIAFNSVIVGFTAPTKGTVVIQRGQTEGSAPPLIAFEESFTNSNEWIVNHQLGHNPIIRVIVNGHEVQPLNIEYTNTMSAKVTFSTPQTGSVRCI